MPAFDDKLVHIENMSLARVAVPVGHRTGRERKRTERLQLNHCTPTERAYWT
jgi:hypothetical protein